MPSDYPCRYRLLKASLPAAIHPEAISCIPTRRRQQWSSFPDHVSMYESNSLQLRRLKYPTQKSARSDNSRVSWRAGRRLFSMLSKMRGIRIFFLKSSLLTSFRSLYNLIRNSERRISPLRLSVWHAISLPAYQLISLFIRP